jgi:hypothetical protein
LKEVPLFDSGELLTQPNLGFFEMADMLDSKPVFQTRLAAVGLSAVVIGQLQAKGINTLAKLAYSSGGQPSKDEAPFLKVMASALGELDPDNIDPGTLAMLRRVWHESHAVALSEIRSQIERTDSTAPARMPIPERSSRLDALQVKLSGVAITTDLEPSHQLVDYVNQLRADEILRYIDPAKCTSREQEVQGVKKSSFLKHNADGSVKVVNEDEQLSADLGGRYEIRIALQRRSLALELVKLMSYKESEKYHDTLFAMLAIEPPSTHSKISMQQLMQADKYLFTKLSTLCRSGISQRPDGSFPMETHFQEASRNPVVQSCLQFLAKPAGGKGQRQDDHSRGSSPYESKGKGKGKAQGKGKGKGDAKVREPAPVPKELEGLKTTTKAGGRICFRANLSGGCSYAKWGQSCKVGLHVCMRCGLHHGALDGKCAKAGA